MEQSPSWEADSRSTNQEILCLTRNPKFHCCGKRTRHWSLSWARWVQSTSRHPVSL